MATTLLEGYEPFLHLCGSLHFGRSSRALHMSPSALTRCIQKLEEAVGQPLFERDKRHVALTRAGEIFREHARSQLKAHRQLLDTLADEQGEPRGELRVACTVTACHSILPRLLERCRATYPGIHLQLSTSDAAHSLQRLHAEEVDLAVVPMPDAPDSTLAFAKLAHTPLSFVAPAQDRTLRRRARRVGSDWNGLPLIVPRRGLERERIDAWLRARKLRPELYAEVDGNEAILAMVSLGCGVGVVPELVRLGSPLRSAIIRVSVADPPAGFDVALCAKKRGLSRRNLAAFWRLADGANERGG